RFTPQIAKAVGLLSKSANNGEANISSQGYYERIDAEKDRTVRLMAIRIKHADRTDNLSCFTIMDLNQPIDRPEDALRRPGLTTEQALRGNLDETKVLLSPLDPENDRLRE